MLLLSSARPATTWRLVRAARLLLSSGGSTSPRATKSPASPNHRTPRIIMSGLLLYSRWKHEQIRPDFTGNRYALPIMPSVVSL